jgi:hypothetical protein
MKLTIEIEDVADKKACMRATRQLYEALEAQYGEKEVRHFWGPDLQKPHHLARLELEKAIYGEPIEYDDLRLIFKYFAMAKPSKERLAKELALKNEYLHAEWKTWSLRFREWQQQTKPDTPRLPPPQSPAAPYGPRGSTNWQTMLKQIKRVLRRYPEACSAVSKAPEKTREEQHQAVALLCWQRIQTRMLDGHGVRTLRSVRK